MIQKGRFSVGQKSIQFYCLTLSHPHQTHYIN